MIEHKALELLQQTAVLAQQIRPVPEAALPTLAVPGNTALKNIEHLQSGRFRFRGAYATNRLSEFTGYVTRRAEERGVGPSGDDAGRDRVRVFIDVDREKACAIFHLGSPGNAGHADDVANITLAKTAAYAALTAIDGKGQSQRALAEWLEDWAPHLEPFYPEGSQAHGLKQAIAAVRNITIKADSEGTSRVSDLGASRSALESIEASSKDHLPSGFLFHCVPFPGFVKRAFRARVAVITDEKPKLVLRLIGFEDMAEAIGEEFEELARAGLPSSASVYRGTFAL